jgi:hypothetical protein
MASWTRLAWYDMLHFTHKVCILISCIDPPLCASSMHRPHICFQGSCVAHLRDDVTLITYVYQTIIAQTSRDDSVCSLLSKMDEVYTFLIHADLQDIKSMKTVIDNIYHQTLECSYFIREYSQNETFRKSVLWN